MSLVPCSGGIMAWITVVEDQKGNILAELYTCHDKYLMTDSSQSYVHTAAAWCRTCRSFVLVESIPRPEKLEAKTRAWYEEQRSTSVRVAPRFRILSEEQENAIDEKMLRDGLNEAEQWRAVLKTRVSLPRCLNCGESDFLLLPEGGQWLRDNSIQHGPVRVRPNTITHASMNRKGRLYDTEGRRISGRDADW
jgi:hypothetical protein